MKKIELNQDEIRFLRAVLLNNKIGKRVLLKNNSNPDSQEILQLSIDMSKQILEKLK